MGTPSRFAVRAHKFIGIGVFWRSLFYQYELSIVLPLVRFEIGLGRLLV